MLITNGVMSWKNTRATQSGRLDAVRAVVTASPCKSPSLNCAVRRGMHPGRGHSVTHDHRIDFCEDAASYQSCYLCNDAVRNNNWIITGSRYCSAQRRCINSTIGKTLPVIVPHSVVA